MVDWDSWILEANYPSVSLEKWQTTVDLMVEVFNAPAGYIVQHTSRGYQFVITSNQKSNPYDAGTNLPPGTNTFCKNVIKEMGSVYVHNADQDDSWHDDPDDTEHGFISYLGVPIRWPGGHPFGAICVMDFLETNYREPVFKLINQFRGLIECDLDLLIKYKEIKELSLRDELTGLYNRRGFTTLAEQKLSLAKRHHYDLGLMFFDIDDLKNINDTYGHQSGDETIKTFASALKSELRDSDVAARIGGDEFVAFIFAQNDSEIHALISRVQATLLTQKTAHLDRPNIEVSIGHKLFQSKNNITVDRMLAQVDKLMYKNKQQKTTAKKLVSA